MGRVLLSVIEDTSGAHDLLAGGSTPASTPPPTGVAQYARQLPRRRRQARALAARRSALRDVLRAGLGRCRRAASSGTRRASAAGDFVDLRAEMNLVLVLSNCPHPLDPAPACAAAGPITLIRHRAPRAGGGRSVPHRLARGGARLHVHRPAFCLRRADHDRRPSTPMTFRPNGRGRAFCRRGQTLRIIDSEGQQAVDALLYCAADPAERYSAQDTLRVQGSAYVGLGTRLVSNSGPRDGAHHGGQLRPARHLGRLLLLREQCGALRRADPLSARLPRELHPRALALRPDQARHRVQPELLHERADRSVRRTSRSSTASRRRATTSMSRPTWTSSS